MAKRQLGLLRIQEIKSDEDAQLFRAVFGASPQFVIQMGPSFSKNALVPVQEERKIQGIFGNARQDVSFEYQTPPGQAPRIVQIPCADQNQRTVKVSLTLRGDPDGALALRAKNIRCAP